MNSPCVNCGADARVCKECDWYNGIWISKDQYEARLKADMVDILTELHIRMEEIGDDLDPTEDWDYGYKSGVEDMIQLLDDRIGKLKGESDAQEQKKE